MKSVNIATIVVSMLVALATPSVAKDRMAMSWSFEAGHTGFLVAQDTGLYEKAGADLSVERGFGASDTLRRLISGEVQFGVVDALILYQAKAKDPNLDLVMVANVLQQSPYNAVYVKDRKIKTATDVQKAKFGDTGGSVAQLFPAFLAQAIKKPVSALTYQRVVLDPAIRIPALFRGDVDIVASVIFEFPNLEFRAKEAGITLGRFDYGSLGFNPYTYGIVVKRDFAQKNPDKVKAVVKASLEGWAAACKDPDQAARILTKYHGDVPPETVKPEVLLALPTVVSDDTAKHGLGYMNKERWQETFKDAIAGWKLSPDAIKDPNSVWTTDYMPAEPVKATCKG